MNTLTWHNLRMAYRASSRAWPNSYAKAAMTKKFRKWLAENRPEIAC